MRQGFPPVKAGRRIGLLGGSFDPAHAGHVHITKEALKRFGLDEVWWLVTPGNPLKQRQPAPLLRRLENARELMSHPKVRVTDLEARLGTRFTAETIAALQAHYPGVRFVWLMGADNLAQFHRWERWQWIAENVALGILARPGQRISARLSIAAARYERSRIRGRASRQLSGAKAPAWCFVNLPMMDISSTAIRASGAWDT